jgi:hypothetical protein
MPTVGELERLSALVKRLTPLSARARGDLITADDWNLLVGALLEVARAVVDAEGDESVPPHEHPGQVSLGWLDPKVRALVERGSLQDPQGSIRLTGAERALAAAGSRIDVLEASLDGLRGTLGTFETEQLTQRNAVAGIRRAIDNVADPRDELLEFRSTLDSVRGEIAASSAVVRGFADVKPEDILARLAKADELRASLTTATGALMDASEFDRRLAELRTTLVTEDELTAAIKKVRTPSDLLDKLRPVITEESRLAATAAADAAIGPATDSLRGEFRDELAAARGQLTDEGTRLRTEIAGQATTLHEELERRATELAATLGAQAETLRTEFGEVRDRIIAGIDGAVEQRVTAALDARLVDVSDRIGGLLSRLDTVETSVRDLDTQIGARFDEFDGRLTTRLDGIDATIRDRDSVIDRLKVSLTQELSQLIEESKTTIETSLRSEIATVTEAQKSLGTSLRRSIAVERRRVDGIIEAPPG